jgi:hypothetical protein
MGGTRGGGWQIDKVDCTLPAYSLLIQHSYIENGQFTADLPIKALRPKGRYSTKKRGLLE